MNDHQVTFFNKITESAARLTATENMIAEYLMTTYPNCMLKTSYELARETNVNVSTISRFFQKIGYKSIKTAQNDFKKAIDLQASSAQKRMEEEFESDTKKSRIGAHSINEAANIDNTFNGIATDDLDILIGILSNRKNRVVIAGGDSPSGAIAHYLFGRMKQVRPNVLLTGSDEEELARIVASTETNDVIFIFDYKKYSNRNKALTGAYNKRGGRVVLFTDSPLAPLVKKANICFETRTTSPSRFGSQVAAMALVNLIVDMLAENWEDFIEAQAQAVSKAVDELGL